MIDLSKYGELWQDFYDLLMVQARKKEERVSWDAVKAELKTEGKL